MLNSFFFFNKLAVSDVTPVLADIYVFERKRETERVSRGGAERERERERERIPNRLHLVSTEADVGLDLTNREIMT